MPLFTFESKGSSASSLQFEGDTFGAALTFAASVRLSEVEVCTDGVPVCTIRRAAEGDDFWILQARLTPSAVEHARCG